LSKESEAGSPADAITIRRASVADAGAAARLIEPAFVRFIAPTLSTVGRVAFRLYVTEKALRARLKGGAVAWCAVDVGSDVLAGYAELGGRDGTPGGIDHLTLLFTALDRQGQGVARRLLAAATAHLGTAEPPVRQLTVNASAFALPIYERLGFVRSAANTEEGGIVATPMLYDLGRRRTSTAEARAGASRRQTD
jgi:GNAT superfamily N-acetyltransferase